MSVRINYKICPECGHANPELKAECPACSNRLFSDDLESHCRYIKIVETEHKKRLVVWYGGWTVVVLIFIGMPTLLIVGHSNRVPSAGAIVGAMVLSWRLIDL